jgi:signal transduction histidine kinase
MAEAVNAAKLATLGMLVAGVAHELNTPLGALNSNHDVLKRALGKLQVILADEVVEPDELDEVRRIVAAVDGVMRVNDLAVERMVGLVASLRSFGRPDRSELDRVDPREGIESTLAILRHLTKDRIEIVRDYGHIEPFECYPNQLNQVFMNLLLNASQAIVDSGTITIRTRARDGGAVIEIEDTGAGIAAENLDRIFEPGFTTKGARVGMGLGLLISRQIVEHHGGRIDVRSQPGVGTKFTVSLPAGGHGSSAESA